MISGVGRTVITPAIGAPAAQNLRRRPNVVYYARRLLFSLRVRVLVSATQSDSIRIVRPPGPITVVRIIYDFSPIVRFLFCFIPKALPPQRVHNTCRNYLGEMPLYSCGIITSPVVWRAPVEYKNESDHRRAQHVTIRVCIPHTCGYGFVILPCVFHFIFLCKVI